MAEEPPLLALSREDLAKQLRLLFTAKEMLHSDPERLNQLNNECVSLSLVSGANFLDSQESAVFASASPSA